MHPIYRVSDGRMPGDLWSLSPRRITYRIIFKSLANVVNKSAGDKYIPIEFNIWHDLFEGVRQGNHHLGNGPLVIKLTDAGIDPILAGYLHEIFEAGLGECSFP